MSGETTPWLDLGPAKLLEVHGASDARPDHRVGSVVALAGIYAGFATWTYFAWYRMKTHGFTTTRDGDWKIWESSGWFSPERYAGGADKFGHTWATMGLARGGAELLNQWGGFPRTASVLVGTALSEALFLGVEVKDGYIYGFSYGDFTFNTLGAGLALALSLSPRLDEMFDYRVQYWPSGAYRRQFEGGNVNVAEDYSGETYLLAYHLGSIERLRDWHYGTWAPFIDVVLGFETRGYKPDPPYKVDPTDPTKLDYAKHQSTFIGLSLNAQGLFDALLRHRSKPGKKITHGLFEVFNLPFTTLKAGERTVVPSGSVPDDQTQ